MIVDTEEKLKSKFGESKLKKLQNLIEMLSLFWYFIFNVYILMYFLSHTYIIIYKAWLSKRCVFEGSMVKEQKSGKGSQPAVST